MDWHIHHFDILLLLLLIVFTCDALASLHSDLASSHSFLKATDLSSIILVLHLSRTSPQMTESLIALCAIAYTIHVFHYVTLGSVTAGLRNDFGDDVF